MNKEILSLPLKCVKCKKEFTCNPKNVEWTDSRKRIIESGNRGKRYLTLRTGMGNGWEAKDFQQWPLRK